MIDAATLLLVRAAEEEFDPDTVTPGVWGFVLTFLVMVVVVLLVLDMVRRIRRVNYRAEVREQLEAERREQELRELESTYAAPEASNAPDAPRAADSPGAASGPDAADITPEPGSASTGEPAASDDDEAPPKR